MPEQKAHLLLVEDETPLRLALADLLADAGFHDAQLHPLPPTAQSAVLATA